LGAVTLNIVHTDTEFAWRENDQLIECFRYRGETGEKRTMLHMYNYEGIINFRPSIIVEMKGEGKAKKAESEEEEDLYVHGIEIIV
jgi:hypothetical protein